MLELHNAQPAAPQLLALEQKGFRSREGFKGRKSALGRDIVGNRRMRFALAGSNLFRLTSFTDRKWLISDRDLLVSLPKFSYEIPALKPHGYRCITGGDVDVG